MDELFEGEKAWYDRDPIFEALTEASREHSEKYGLSACFTGSGRLHHIDVTDEDGELTIWDDPERLLRFLKGGEGIS